MMTDSLFHKRLLDHLRTAVLLLDGDLVVRYLNPAAEMLLSVSAARIVGGRSSKQWRQGFAAVAIYPT